MQIRESPLTVPESLDLRGGPAGWQSPVNGCLQVPQCRTLKFRRLRSTSREFQGAALGNLQTTVDRALPTSGPTAQIERLGHCQWRFPYLHTSRSEERRVGKECT